MCESSHWNVYFEFLFFIFNNWVLGDDSFEPIYEILRSDNQVLMFLTAFGHVEAMWIWLISGARIIRL